MIILLNEFNHSIIQLLDMFLFFIKMLLFGQYNILILLLIENVLCYILKVKENLNIFIV